MAPVKKNQKIGELILKLKDGQKYQFDLFSHENIEKVGFIRKIKFLLQYKINNFLTNNVFR